MLHTYAAVIKLNTYVCKAYYPFHLFRILISEQFEYLLFKLTGFGV